MEEIHAEHIEQLVYEQRIEEARKSKAHGSSGKCASCGKGLPKTIKSKMKKCPHCGKAVTTDSSAIEEAQFTKKDGGKQSEDEDEELKALVAKFVKRGMPEAAARKIAKKSLAKKKGGGDSKSKPPWLKEADTSAVEEAQVAGHTRRGARGKLVRVESYRTEGGGWDIDALRRGTPKHLDVNPRGGGVVSVWTPGSTMSSTEVAPRRERAHSPSPWSLPDSPEKPTKWDVSDVDGMRISSHDTPEEAFDAAAAESAKAKKAYDPEIHKSHGGPVEGYDDDEDEKPKVQSVMGGQTDAEKAEAPGARCTGTSRCRGRRSRGRRSSARAMGPSFSARCARSRRRQRRRSPLRSPALLAPGDRASRSSPTRPPAPRSFSVASVTSATSCSMMGSSGRARTPRCAPSRSSPA